MTRFVISDTHFGHERILGYRPEFSTVEEMDEKIVENWNAVVREGDTVYHLGDVCLNRRHLATVKRLNGRKILIKGNHDLFPLKDYLAAGFKDIRACVVVDETAEHGGGILTHIPLHASQLVRFGRNIHGHLHTGIIPEPWYLNVCVEKTGYAPVELYSLLG
jgi:calcineurin-like phosphoesterase family protein